MSTITIPNSFSAGTTIQSSQVNANFNVIANDYNGNIANANIASGAAIASTKLNLSTITQTITMSGVADNWAQGADIASATTTNIGAATGNFVNITGVTTITAFDTVAAGAVRALKFAGILTLTHNATSLFLPNAGSNITTAANDTAIFVSLGSGNWRCLSYTLASGRALVGTTGIFTTAYTSSAQTITAAGQLVLAHSLGATPSLISVRLVNQSTELGYSAADEVFINPSGNSIDTASDKGLSIVPDATNLTIRFGSNASSISIIRKDTGGGAGIDVTKWKAVFRAWV